MSSAVLGGMADKPRQNLAARAFKLAEYVFNLYRRLAAAGPAHAHVAHQLLRAATAIGALLEEGAVANSRRDMAAKYAIALRESRESNYWSRLGSTDPKWVSDLAFVTQETSEFIAMLTVSVRKLRQPIADQPDGR
jgi:four helix bundle protein